MKEGYLHSVRALLDCPAGEKERLLSRLDSALTAYLADVPEADEADVVSNFGTPEDCAARLLDECAPGVVASERQKKKRRHRILVAVLAALFVAAMGLAVYLWSNGGLVIIETGKITPEKAREFERGHVIYEYED